MVFPDGPLHTVFVPLEFGGPAFEEVLELAVAFLEVSDILIELLDQILLFFELYFNSLQKISVPFLIVLQHPAQGLDLLVLLRQQGLHLLLPVHQEVLELPQEVAIRRGHFLHQGGELHQLPSDFRDGV